MTLTPTRTSSRTATPPLIDDAPLSAFHRKLTVFSSAGPFIDGYAISIIGLTWPTMTQAVPISTSDQGLIAAAVLVGIFVGGLVFGRVTDAVGRHRPYVAVPLAILVVSMLSFAVSNVWQILALRFLTGLAIGADYPIATSLLAEFLPSKNRGRMLGATFVVWTAGAAAAPAIAMMCTAWGGAAAWRWMLASSGFLALVVFFMRLHTPESARWLQSKGRLDEAEHVITTVFGPQYDIRSLGEPESVPEGKASYGTVFRAPYLTRTLFVGIFWRCQVIPLFSIYSFSYDLLATVSIKGNGAEFFLNALFVVGGVAGLLLVDRVGRKNLLIYSFGVITVVWFLAGLIPGLPALVTLAAVCIFAILNGGSNFLEVVYPNELFPTEVRATATGIGTAASRIGAAVAVYLMPFALQHGVNVVLIAGAIVSLVGLAVTLAWGVETAGKSLSTAAG